MSSCHPDYRHFVKMRFHHWIVLICGVFMFLCLLVSTSEPLKQRFTIFSTAVRSYSVSTDVDQGESDILDPVANLQYAEAKVANVQGAKESYRVNNRNIHFCNHCPGLKNLLDDDHRYCKQIAPWQVSNII